MPQYNVFLAVPLYGRDLDWGTSKAVWRCATQSHRVDICQMSSSLLTMNCNMLWCTALNMRGPKNLQWFAMLHADIEPSDWWLDTLITEAEKHGADMMSAIVPLDRKSVV